MKDTPAGVGGSDGITAPPGTCPGIRSITGKLPWVGIEGMDMGVPCCITAEPGGEEPPGGKKTWAMAPEDIQGLALAIQSPVCWLPGTSQHTHAQTHAQVQSRVPRKPTVIQTVSVEERGVHTLTHGHTHWAESPGSSVSCVHPLPVDQGRNPYPGSGGFSSFQPLLPRSLSSSDSCYCSDMTSMSNVCERLIKTLRRKTTLLLFFLLHLLSPPSFTSLVQRSCSAEEKVQTWLRDSRPWERKNINNAKLCCAPLQAELQNGLLKQETVRMKES